MKFALAIHGSRGDVEPGAAVGLELLRRGHEVRIAVPPNLVGFVESAGLGAVAYGPDSQKQLEEDFIRNFWKVNFGKVQNPIRLVRAGKEYPTQGWVEMSRTLTTLADGADLVLTGGMYQEVGADIAEYYDIPLAVPGLLCSARQRPAHSDPAVAVAPLRDFGGLVATLAHDEGS
jgi:UDP:flavonoid glycosyltransferase YjiC (YdhE family)